MKRNDTTQSEKESFRFTDFAGPAVVFALFIGVWYLLSLVILPQEKRFLLPTPHRVVREGFFVWSAGQQRGLKPILLSLWDSAKIAMIGLSITIVVGVAIGADSCNDAAHSSAHRWRAGSAHLGGGTDRVFPNRQQHIVRFAVY
jgi:ABC-type nitrate/sulfonate/bicarbonate transport system permease component